MDSRLDLETTYPRGWAERQGATERAFSMMDDNTDPEAKARKGREVQKALSKRTDKRTKE